MPTDLEHIQADEFDGISVSDLHKHVEKVQEENCRLECLLQEARSCLEDLIQATDEDEAEEALLSAKLFLEHVADTDLF